MDYRPTVLERAYELARSGECGSVNEVRARLQKEHYVLAQLLGPTLISDLGRLCRSSKMAKT